MHVIESFQLRLINITTISEIDYQNTTCNSILWNDVARATLLNARRAPWFVEG